MLMEARKPSKINVAFLYNSFIIIIIIIFLM